MGIRYARRVNGVGIGHVTSLVGLGSTDIVEHRHRHASPTKGIGDGRADLVEELLADDCLRAATLTRSGPAGRAVAATAGEHLKKTVLELGGSDPFVALEDADLDAAAGVGAWARNQNNGQSCIAAKRFIVHTDVYDAFLEKFVAEFEGLPVGDPTDEDTEIGPQAKADLMEELHAQVEDSVAAGARAVTGGEPIDSEGAYYPPTILTEVPEGAPADTDEVFGPVAPVTAFADEEEAIAIANASDLALDGCVFTADHDRALSVARRIDADAVRINGAPEHGIGDIPFGGNKDSGISREGIGTTIEKFVRHRSVIL